MATTVSARNQNYNREMDELYRNYHPTAEELNAVLGPSWGICRKTPANMQRYQKCVSSKEYEQAIETALRNRCPVTAGGKA